MNGEDYQNVREKMKKAIAVYKEELASLRAGRANPLLIDRIIVDYYGVPTPVNQLGNISVPEARIIMIHPWDTGIIKDIEKAIQKSNIGINPVNDGKVIRLVFPELTGERRMELIKTIKKKAEDTKVAIRSIRRNIIEYYKEQKKNSEITEDDLKDTEREIQEMTDKYIKEVDNIAGVKEKEVLEV